MVIFFQNHKDTYITYPNTDTKNSFWCKVQCNLDQSLHVLQFFCAQEKEDQARI